MTKNKISSPIEIGSDMLMGGASIAAIIALAKQYAEAKRQARKKEELEKRDIDPGTVVLRIPKSRDKLAEDTTVNVKPAVETKEIRPLSEGQLRDTAGRFATVDEPLKDGAKEKSAQSIVGGAGSILAAGGGAVLGYYLISKLADKLEQKRLKKQIAAAQTEYLDLLDGRNVKNAEAFSTLFMFNGDDNGELSKEAGVPTDLINLIGGIPKRINQAGSAALAAYILTAGGTAYVVKRYLEDRFGKRDKQEDPEKQTRILFKAGSSEFDITPEQMMATVSVLRDCIRDSVPPGVKQASGYDYSFLDDIAKMKGGDQWILDSYAKQNGLKREGTGDFKLPLSLTMKYSKTLGDIAKNPEKHKQALQGHVMGMMQRDPRRWFELLGQQRNSDLVRMKADEQINNLSNGGGILGFLTKIPLIGQLIKGIMSWYHGNTGWGRQATGRKTLEMMGVSPDMAREVVKKYDFSSPGGWSRKTASFDKKAAIDDSVIAFLARRKTLADASNREVIKAIEDLKASRSRKKKQEPKLSVEFDDSIGDLLSDEDKARIIAGLTNGK